MPPKFCKKCHNSVIATMRICPQCGHRLFSESSIQGDPKTIQGDPQIIQGDPKIQTTPNVEKNNVTSKSNTLDQSYASFWERLAARMIDSLVLQVVGFVIGFLLAIGFGLSDLGTIYLLSFAGAIFYNVLMESSSKKGTLGKNYMGLQVTDFSHNQISFWRALSRYFASLISLLIILIGYLIQPFTAKRQTLHDIISETVVTKSITSSKSNQQIAIIIMISVFISILFNVVSTLILKFN